MSPKKIIGLSFAAAAAKLYEVFDKLERARVLPAHALHLSRSRKKASRGDAVAGFFAVYVRFVCAVQTVCPCAQRFFLLPKMPLRCSLTASFIDSA